MILVADSGTSSSDWMLNLPDSKPLSFRTKGLNPFFVNEKEIERLMKEVPEIIPYTGEIREVYFFGAGCVTPDRREIVSNALTTLFPKAFISVESDLLGSAFATCGQSKGYIATLGTGSDISFFNGEELLPSIHGNGYVLGVTSYYDNLIIRRCDIWTEQEYLQQLAVDFNIIYNRPGRHLQSAAAASFDTWIKQYRPDENSSNVSISYYNKGALHALALDILILTSTNALHRLDSVLKAAYEQFYLMDNRGFEEQELQHLAHEVTGVDVSKIFMAAHQTEELDYNNYLNLVGYQLINLNEKTEALSLGIRFTNVEGKLIVKGIDRGTAAWVAGINVEDELIAINDLRVDPSGKTIDYFLSQCKEHEELRCLVSRSGILRTISVVLLKSDKKYYSIERNPNATESERQLGNIWLSL